MFYLGAIGWERENAVHLGAFVGGGYELIVKHPNHGRQWVVGP